MARGDKRLALDRVKPSVQLASFNVCPPPFDPAFRIRGVNMYLVVEGQMASKTPDGAWHLAQRNSLVTFYTGVHQYRVVSRGPLAIHQTVFTSAPPPLEEGIPWLEGVGALPRVLPMGDRASECIPLFEGIMHQLLHLPATWSLDASAAQLTLLSIAFQVAGQIQPSVPVYVDKWRRLMIRLSEEQTSLPTVQELAADMGMSVNHFIREFRRKNGKTPKQYVLQRHLWSAHLLLREGASVKAAALETGFRDPSYFARLYGKWCGHPPADAKKRRDGAPLPPPLVPGFQHILAPGVTFRMFLP